MTARRAPVTRLAAAHSSDRGSDPAVSERVIAPRAATSAVRWRDCSTSIWIDGPANIPTATDTAVVVHADAGYSGGPTRSIGPTRIAVIAATAIPSWRRLPYMASQMTGSITSGV